MNLSIDPITVILFFVSIPWIALMLEASKRCAFYIVKQDTIMLKVAPVIVWLSTNGAELYFDITTSYSSRILAVVGFLPLWVMASILFRDDIEGEVSNKEFSYTVGVWFSIYLTLLVLSFNA